MPFNLPAPWDPGFALPDNVEDEGLQRRGFVTKWMPRGTYDDPKVGTGGYAVPRYVMDEGIGQGAIVTAWQRRGSAPNVPYALNRRPQVLSQRSLGIGQGTAVTMAALSGTDGAAAASLHPLHQQFGARAAQIVLAAVAKLPADQRTTALNQILDRIEPGLGARTAALVAASGNTSAALPAALATAMATGYATEIVDTGKRGSVKRHSAVGLGAYGPPRQGLGGAFDALVGALAPAVAAQNQRDAEMLQLQKTQLAAQTGSYLEVGPFILKPTLPQTLKLDTAALTTAQKNKLYAGLINAVTRSPLTVCAVCQFISKASLGDANAPQQTKTLVKGIEAGMLPWMPLVTALPVYRFEQGGKKYIIKLRSIGTAAKPRVEYLVEEYRGLIDSIFNAIEKLVAKIVNFAVDVVGSVITAVSGLACSVSQNPNAATAAQIAAVAAGQPPQAGAAGAQIAASLCPPTPPPPAAEESSNMLPLALGALGIGAVLLLTRKRS